MKLNRKPKQKSKSKIETESQKESRNVKSITNSKQKVEHKVETFSRAQFYYSSIELKDKS